jgi:hypothetical protein
VREPLNGGFHLLSEKVKSMRMLLFVCLSLFSLACGHATHVRPTPRGQAQVEATLGGPFAKVSGMVIPLPLSTVGGSVGLTDELDVHAHLHGTSLAFGVGGLDVGASYMPIREKGWVPAVTFTGRFYGFTDLKAFVPYLELTGSASYQWAKRHLLYASVSTLAQTSRWPLWSLSVGNEFRFGNFGLQLEGRWYQPATATAFQVVDWQSLGGQGAYGALLGLSYRFDVMKEKAQ